MVASLLMWIWKLTTRFEYQILVKLFSLSAWTQASPWNDTTTRMLPKSQLMLRWQKASEKEKVIHNCFWCWFHTPSPLRHFLSLILGSPLPLTWWRHFWMAPLDFLNSITSVSESRTTNGSCSRKLWEDVKVVSSLIP